VVLVGTTGLDEMVVNRLFGAMQNCKNCLIILDLS